MHTIYPVWIACPDVQFSSSRFGTLINSFSFLVANVRAKEGAEQIKGLKIWPPNAAISIKIDVDIKNVLVITLTVITSAVDNVF